jgi:hypothetical protein
MDTASSSFLQRKSKANPHGLTVAELKELCRLRGQSTSGNKSRLWERLTIVWKQADPEGWVTNLHALTHPSEAVYVASCAARKSKHNPHGRSLIELRVACSASGLSTKGNKRQLCERLYGLTFPEVQESTTVQESKTALIQWDDCMVDKEGKLHRRWKSRPIPDMPLYRSADHFYRTGTYPIQLKARYALFNETNTYAKMIETELYQIATMVNVYNTFMAMQECGLKADFLGQEDLAASHEQKSKAVYVDRYQLQKLKELGCLLPDSKIQFLVCVQNKIEVVKIDETIDHMDLNMSWVYSISTPQLATTTPSR